MGTLEFKDTFSILEPPAVFHEMGSFHGIQESRGGLEPSAAVGMGAVIVVMAVYR